MCVFVCVRQCACDVKKCLGVSGPIFALDTLAGHRCKLATVGTVELGKLGLDSVGHASGVLLVLHLRVRTKGQRGSWRERYETHTQNNRQGTGDLIGMTSFFLFSFIVCFHFVFFSSSSFVFLFLISFFTSSFSSFSTSFYYFSNFFTCFFFFSQFFLLLFFYFFFHIQTSISFFPRFYISMYLNSVISFCFVCPSKLFESILQYINIAPIVSLSDTGAAQASFGFLQKDMSCVIPTPACLLACPSGNECTSSQAGDRR